MRRLILMYLLLPLQALAADDIDKEGHWFAVVTVGAFLLYSLIKKPEWFRKSIKQRVAKHEKYVAWTRDQSEHAKSLSDEEIWKIIEDAVTRRVRVAMVLFFLLIVFIFDLYPVYAEPILGPNPPYWHEMLLGAVGGGAFAAIIALVARASLRMRIRQLINNTKSRIT